MAILPPIAIPSLNNTWISFQFYAASTATRLEVGICDDTSRYTRNFIPIDTLHADRPNRIMPIMVFVEYAKEGGEANVSAVGYGGNQVTGLSPRTDTYTMAQHDPALAASLSKAMNLPFDVFYFDENDVVYGRRVGEKLLGFPITTLYPTVTPHPTSSNPATLTVSFERYHIWLHNR